MSDFERELDWNDTIEKESDFPILPEGVYNFTVAKYERARHAGSAKLPPCNKAIIFAYISTPQGSTTIIHQLFLHTKTEGLLSAFFKSIGAKQTGERVQMNFDAAVGKSGICSVGVRTWTGDDGEERQANEIKKFFDAADAPTPLQEKAKSFTPGSF